MCTDRKADCQQTIESRSAAAARHIHTDWHIGAVAVVHLVDNAVVVSLCLPTCKPEKVLVRDRRDNGFGLANIFRFFRIDGFWRLTHRSQEDPSRNFTINVGMDFSF